MMIRVFYNGRTHRTRAIGEYDTDTGKVTVLKGTIVSESVAEFAKTEKIKKLREQYIDEEGVLQKNITFNSPSAAAVFVAGYSVNGLLAWRIEKYKPLKNVLNRDIEMQE